MTARRFTLKDLEAQDRPWSGTEAAAAGDSPSPRAFLHPTPPHPGLHVICLLGDLQEGLSTRHSCIVHQQVHRADTSQRLLRGLLVS